MTDTPVLDPVVQPTPTPTPAPPAPAAPTPAPAAPTLLKPDPAGDPAPADAKPVVPADWPADWRDKAAGDDPKFRTRLDRFGSPVDLVKSYRALEQKVSSGEVRQPLPEKATPEQITQYRKDNGIPDKPEDYKIELKNGMVLGEADKPIIADFAKMMHGKNMPNAHVNEVVQAYYEMQDQQAQKLLELDTDHRQKAEDALRAEWGAEYRRNTQGVDNFLGGAPDGLGALIANGRLADGSMIANDPRFIKWINSINLELNPASTLVPAGSDTGKALGSRLEEIRSFRRASPDAYDQDKAMQAEELKLIEAQSKMSKRA